MAFFFIATAVRAYFDVPPCADNPRNGSGVCGDM